MINAILFTSVAVLGVGADDKPHELFVGDPAPKLEIQRFIRGEPVREFQRGKTYVVAFWCGGFGTLENLISIQHLTALQKKYKDVIFLGVSSDEILKAATLLVAKTAGKMEFRVAIEAFSGGKGKMTSAMARCHVSHVLLNGLCHQPRRQGGVDRAPRRY